MNTIDNLVRVLPKISNWMQLSGVLIIILAVIVTRDDSPNSLKAAITVGAIGTMLILFGVVFKRIKDFPEHSRFKLVITLTSIFCVFALVLSSMAAPLLYQILTHKKTITSTASSIRGIIDVNTHNLLSPTNKTNTEPISANATNDKTLTDRTFENYFSRILVKALAQKMIEKADKYELSLDNVEQRIKNIILKTQAKHVKESLSFIECFTDKDYLKFTEEKVLDSIAYELIEDMDFITVCNTLKAMKVDDRKQIYLSARNTYRRTWEEIGEISRKGQTPAGSKAEQEIAVTMVDLIEILVEESNN